MLGVPSMVGVIPRRVGAVPSVPSVTGCMVGKEEAGKLRQGRKRKCGDVNSNKAGGGQWAASLRSLHCLRSN